MPEISVIVPIYKVEAYLRRCVDSILAQTFTDYELWLVDDGSPDKCGEICDEYAKRDARIRVIHKPNGGLSDARNAALDQATGNYISFVDSDDWVTPDFLESLYHALVDNRADLAVCNIIKAIDGKELINDYKPAEKETVVTGDAMFDTLYRPSACNKLYPARIFKSLRYPKGRLYEDLFIYHDILAQVKKLIYTGKDSYNYFVRNDSIMHAEYRLKCTDIIDGCDARARKLDELGQTFHATKARLHIYSQTALAFAKLSPSVPEKALRLAEIKAIYDRHYPMLMTSKDVSGKQKLRLRLFRFSPRLHNWLYRIR